MLIRTLVFGLLILVNFATSKNSYAIGEAEYKFPAKIDAEILSDQYTELWARVFWPGSTNEVSDGTHPLVIFLHGNHSTCGYGENPRNDNSNEYTYYGTCPSGYRVTPNHRGYDYIARELSELGFVVVSINANRGINGGYGDDADWGLNKARGRLILKHLQLLSEWNQKGGSQSMLGVELWQHLDLKRVGLVGHSRGGEGVRAAFKFLNEIGSPWPTRMAEKVKIRAILEIAPVDGQSSTIFNAEEVAWTVLLPRCDGDVSDLQGIKVFDRAFRRTSELEPWPKSTFYIFGANHNFFNTEWQISDSWSCGNDEPQLWQAGDTESKAQQQIGLETVKAFMMHYVEGDTEAGYNSLFDPISPISPALLDLTEYLRDYIETPSSLRTVRLLDTDDQDVLKEVAVENVSVERQKSLSPSRSGRKVLRLKSLLANAVIKLRVAKGQPVDLASYGSLDLSVRASTKLPSFGIRLLTAEGGGSEVVAFKEYANFPIAWDSALTTVRIPLAAFGTLTKPVSSMELVFDNGKDDFELSSVRVSKMQGNNFFAAASAGGGGRTAWSGGSRVVQTRRLQGAILKRNFIPEKGVAEVTVTSPEGFPTRDALPRLMIGKNEFLVSRYAGSDLRQLTFTVKINELPPPGATARVQYGALNPNLVIELGGW